MKSITGVEFNNPSICIKGNGNFACMCDNCMKEGTEKIKDYFNLSEEEFTKKWGYYPNLFK